MPLILNIETATKVCSIVLAQDENIIASKEINEDKSHSSFITIFIEEVFKKTNYALKDLDAVAVSKGPGSYTGLRIGAATAKGICYALGKPLIAVATLEAMTWGMRQYLMEKGDAIDNLLFCPAIDARRMEVYTAIYNSEGRCVQDTDALIIDQHTFSEVLSNNKMIFFGDGAKKIKPLLPDNAKAVFIDDFLASARHMVYLSQQAYRNKQFEDAAYFEPFYLKEFLY